MKTFPFSFKPNIRKMILLFDEPAFLESISIMDYLTFQKVETNIYIEAQQMKKDLERYVQHKFPNHQFISSFTSFEISKILSQQGIGTHLFISGKWPMIQAVKEKAYQVGFSEDEIQTMGIGPKEEKVFCVKCYSYNLKKEENEISCEHCNTLLDVSKHFSKRRNAYLGYIKIG